MTNSLAIEVLDLHRSFDDTKAVQGFRFDVQHGEIFRLLGRMAPARRPPFPC